MKKLDAYCNQVVHDVFEKGAVRTSLEETATFTPAQMDRLGNVFEGNLPGIILVNIGEYCFHLLVIGVYAFLLFNNVETVDSAEPIERLYLPPFPEDSVTAFSFGDAILNWT